MPANTSRLTIPYPLPADVPDGAAQMQAIAARLDAIAAWYVQGTAAARPAAGVQGKVYLSTDTGEVAFDTGTQWVVLVPAGSARLADVGDLKTSVRKTDHSGWLVADGRALASGSYPALRAMLVADGNPFGVSGSNPLIPDAKGRVLVSAGAGSGLTARTVGQAGGAESHTLTAAQMPAHSHVVNDPGHVHGLRLNSAASPNTGVEFIAGTGNYVDVAGNEITSASTGVTLQNTGGGASHPIMPPFLVAQVFIYGGSAT